MSLLSPDSLLLHLAPEKIRAVHVRGWRQQIAGWYVKTPESVTPIGSDTKALVSAAMGLVHQLKPSTARIVVSDHLTRYFCCPWQAQLRSDAEELAFAQLMFDDIYGARSHVDWQIIRSRQIPGKAKLAMAIPKSLMDSLVKEFSAAKIRLLSVRPQLATAIGAFSAVLPKAGWVASHEPGRLSLAGWDAQGWNWAASTRVDGALTSLAERIQHEVVIAQAGSGTGLVSRPMFLCAPHALQAQVAMHTGKEVQQWQLSRSMQKKILSSLPAKKTMDATLAEFGNAIVGLGA